MLLWLSLQLPLQSYQRHITSPLSKHSILSSNQENLEKLPNPAGFIDKDTIANYAYVTHFALGPRKKVIVYQFAPANWVELIENGAPDEDKRTNVKSDLRTLTEELKIRDTFDVVG